jgi:hypothetical protein
LDELRRQQDPDADATIARLIADGGAAAVGPMFQMVRANDDPLPADAPQPLKDFMASSAGLPPWLDQGRIERGGRVFLRHALPAALVLLAGSLPRGYAAPCLCNILSISQDLQRHPYDRLMGVLQLLVNISDPRSFDPRGRAVVTAQKLRLLHAGVRSLVPRYRPNYEERFGAPVNHEDMLATIMGFSYLLIDGLRRLKTPFLPEQAEDLYYLWRVFALLMGIHPEGQPHDDSLIPASVAEAEEFYAAYVRRHDTPASENPYGEILTRNNLEMMQKLIPRPLWWLGFRWAPQICMTDILTPEELARVGFAPLPGHQPRKTLLTLVLWLFQGVMAVTPFSGRLAALIFQGMIDQDRGGQVTFSIPFTLLGLRGSALE